MPRRGERGHRPQSRLHLKDLLVEALAGVTRRAGRSALTVLGTLLGVGAFVATLGLTTTAAAQVSSRFDALQATQVVVQDARPDPSDPRPAFPPDAEQRLARLNGVEHAGVVWTVGGPHVVRTSSVRDASGAGEAELNVIAASPGALQAAGAHIAVGRAFDHFHADRGERVALLGQSAASRLGIQRIDQQPAIFIDGRLLTVLGIVADTKRRNDLLASVILPPRTAARLFPSDQGQPEILVSTKLGAAQLIGQQAPLALRPDDPDRLISVVPPDPKALRRDVTGDINQLLLLLAGVSMVIGAIGIANTTHVSVLERVSEIGLRRALGAARRHVAAQFLAESMLLGTIGGLLGASLAVMLVVGVAATRQWTAVLDVRAVLPAPFIGTLTGLVAGLYPAMKAARVQPVEALNR